MNHPSSQSLMSKTGDFDSPPLGLPQGLGGLCASPNSVAVPSSAEAVEPLGQAQGRASEENVLATLFLRLEGPLQSWGGRTIGRFRRTESVPTKSGVLGLLGAALGLSRQQLNARLEELNQLTMSVRVDRAGHIEEDYQTVGAKVGVLAANGVIKETAGTGEVEAIISPREFLIDASFLVLLQGDSRLIEKLSAALQVPQWPLFLGRKRCVPGVPVFAGVTSNVSLSAAILSDGPDDASLVPPDERSHVRVVTDLLSLPEFATVIDATGSVVEEVYEESKAYVTDRLVRLDPPVHGGRIVLDFTIEMTRLTPTRERPDLSDPLFGEPGPQKKIARANDPEARKLAREKAGTRCIFCRLQPDDPRSLHAHHRTYLRRSRERVSDDMTSTESDDGDDDFVMLCEECHAAVTLLEYQNGFGLTRVDPVNPAWRGRIQQAREARRRHENSDRPLVHPGPTALANLASDPSVLIESVIPLKAGSRFADDAPGNRWLTNRQHVHQRLSMAFPESGGQLAAAGYGVTRDEGSFLFRIEHGPVARILVRSRIAPDWGRAFQNAGWLVDQIPSPRVFDTSDFVAGIELDFRVEANPTKRLAFDSPEGRKGARVALRDDAALAAWINRQAASGGFEILPESLVIDRVGRQTASLKRAANRHWDAVSFHGRLVITDAAAFAEALAKGIGSAKGFGFGLLSVERASDFGFQISDFKFEI